MTQDRCEGERVLDERRYHSEATKRVTREEMRAVNERPGESQSNFVERATRIGLVPGNNAASEIGHQNYGIYHSRPNVQTPSGNVTIKANTLANFTWALPISEAEGTAQQKIEKAGNAFVTFANPETGRQVSFGQGGRGLVAQVGDGAVIENPQRVAQELRRAGVTFTPSNAKTNPLPTIADLHRAAEATYCPPRR